MRSPSSLQRLLLPPEVDADAAPLLLARGLRGFADGFVAVLLPAYLTALGLSVIEVGLLATLTLAGSAAATLLVGAYGHVASSLRLLRITAVVMVATGLGFAGFASFWPLALVAFVGTLNPSAGDVSVFLPLEHARLAGAAHSVSARTALFARYSLSGALCGSLGALASAVPAWLSAQGTLDMLAALRAMFVLYAAMGVLVALAYRGLRPDPEADPQINPQVNPGTAVTSEPASTAVAEPGALRSGPAAPARVRPTALGPSRAAVFKLAALFSVDSFAGGLLVQAILALWLFQRFGVSLAQAGVFFFLTGLLGTASQLLAPLIARRFGLVNTMVFTHIPANLLLIAAAFAPGQALAMALLLARAALSQMDVPARGAFVMSVVTPAERAAAASFTAVPRSLASAAAPTLGAALLASGALVAPLVACGVLKIAYDLALLVMFRKYQPPLTN